MQTYLAVAAAVAFLTGVAHSVLGEMLIFRQLRIGTLVPGQDAPPLRSRNIRIIWATWHVATVFGWAFAGVLLQLALSPRASLVSLFLNASVAAYAGGSLLVLIGTRGRHPGWIALAAVAALVWTGARTA
jgi:hypothetical protein